MYKTKTKMVNSAKQIQRTVNNVTSEKETNVKQIGTCKTEEVQSIKM